jgi:hypothetical protein
MARPVLTEDQKRDILALYPQTFDTRVTANQLGVSYHATRRYLINTGVIKPRREVRGSLRSRGNTLKYEQTRGLLVMNWLYSHRGEIFMQRKYDKYKHIVHRLLEPTTRTKAREQRTIEAAQAGTEIINHGT